MEGRSVKARRLLACVLCVGTWAALVRLTWEGAKIQGVQMAGRPRRVKQRRPSLRSAIQSVAGRLFVTMKPILCFADYLTITDTLMAIHRPLLIGPQFYYSSISAAPLSWIRF